MKAEDDEAWEKETQRDYYEAHQPQVPVQSIASFPEHIHKLAQARIDAFWRDARFNKPNSRSAGLLDRRCLCVFAGYAWTRLSTCSSAPEGIIAWCRSGIQIIKMRQELVHRCKLAVVLY